MSFAVPAALMLTAIALPIIALYVLKVRLRRMKVSTNLFWKQVYEEKPPRSLWQNLRHLISLLAQLLLLLLLMLAVADPFFSWQALQARRIVVVLDTSASMKATDVSPSRFEAARSAVHRLLNGLRFRDEVAIVSAGLQPEVVLGMASHTPTLRRALDAVHPSDTVATLDAAIELAKQLIGEHPHGQVLVFSDGCAQRPSDADSTTLTTLATEAATQLSESSPAASNLAEAEQSASNGETSNKTGDEKQTVSVQVVHHTLATSASNVGITQFQARRSLIDPIGYEILVTLHNASDIAIKGRLELELDEIPVDVIPFDLSPNQTWTRTVEKTSLEGGVLRGTLQQLAASDSQPNAEPSNTLPLNTLPTDDIAWAIIPPRKIQDVLIVSPGNLFLRKVFEANPLVNIQVLNQLPETWPANTLVVLHRLIPEKLPAGQVLVVDPESDSNAWKLGDAIENPIVTEQDQDSPLMTHIHLDNVLLPQARRIDFSEPAIPLAATVTGETIYALLNRTDGPCLVLSVNLERSDLAFRTSFPIMTTNALSWFAGQPGELQPALSGGQLTQLNPLAIPSTSTNDQSAEKSVGESTVDMNATLRQHKLRLLSPTGAETPVVSQQVGPLDEIGIWRVALASESDPASEPQIFQRYAVNLANAAETDLRPQEEKLAAQADDADLTTAWFSRPIWFYLIVAATLFCALEWFLYQRRVIS